MLGRHGSAKLSRVWVVFCSSSIIRAHSLNAYSLNGEHSRYVVSSDRGYAASRRMVSIQVMDYFSLYIVEVVDVVTRRVEWGLKLSLDSATPAAAGAWIRSS